MEEKYHYERPKMTLIELTVVILVVMTLIAILFAGVRAWKRGSDRTGCIITIRSIQQDIRAHANKEGLSVGDLITLEDIPGKWKQDASNLKCPAEGTYTFLNVVPRKGELFCTCSHSKELSHVPVEHSNW